MQGKALVAEVRSCRSLEDFAEFFERHASECQQAGGHPSSWMEGGAFVGWFSDLDGWGFPEQVWVDPVPDVPLWESVADRLVRWFEKGEHP